MASSKARKDLTASLQVPDMSGLVFATLELTNEAGRKSATALGRNYSHLSNHHRQFLHVNRISKFLPNARAHCTSLLNSLLMPD